MKNKQRKGGKNGGKKEGQPALSSWVLIHFLPSDSSSSSSASRARISNGIGDASRSAIGSVEITSADRPLPPLLLRPTPALGTRERLLGGPSSVDARKGYRASRENKEDKSGSPFSGGPPWLSGPRNVKDTGVSAVSSAAAVVEPMMMMMVVAAAVLRLAQSAPFAASCRLCHVTLWRREAETSQCIHHRQGALRAATPTEYWWTPEVRRIQPPPSCFFYFKNPRRLF